MKTLRPKLALYGITLHKDHHYDLDKRPIRWVPNGCDVVFVLQGQTAKNMKAELDAIVDNAIERNIPVIYTSPHVATLDPILKEYGLSRQSEEMAATLLIEEDDESPTIIEEVMPPPQPTVIHRANPLVPEIQVPEDWDALVIHLKKTLRKMKEKHGVESVLFSIGRDSEPNLEISRRQVINTTF